MGRQKQHGEVVRNALLAAAEKIVEMHGISALSVRSVADAVETTTRAVYSVFGSKDGLLEALATRLFEILNEAIDGCETSGDPVADVLTISIDGFRRTALDHPALYGLVFLRVAPELRLGPLFNNVADSAFSRLQAHLARISATDDRDDLFAMATAVHALTEGLASMELRGMIQADTDAVQIWRDALHALITGFGRPPLGRGFASGE